MFIPKGAFIFGNIWAILRDPTLYPDPDAFKPERWLQSQGDDEQEKKRDPRAYVFGFGRR
jgi:cytochrome P450